MRSLVLVATLAAMIACGGSDTIVVVDGGPDALAQCNPLGMPGMQGCDAGEKCTWIRLQGAPPSILGKLGCVRDGTVDVGGTCNFGPLGESSGFDDCKAGLICIGAGPGICQDVCGFDGTPAAACPANFACTRYRSTFTNNGMGETALAGACNPTCDMLTQLQTGNGQPCGTGRACYLLSSQTDTSAVCVTAGTKRHGELVDPPAANACLPFHAPRVADPSDTSMFECGALCRPNDVHLGINVADEGGVDDGSAMPQTCEFRGASPPESVADGESCRYWYARERFTTGSPFSNTVGWCLKHALTWRDTNGDMLGDAPYPRCSTIDVGADTIPPAGTPDDTQFWCTQRLPAFQAGAQSRLPPPAFATVDVFDL